MPVITFISKMKNRNTLTNKLDDKNKVRKWNEKHIHSFMPSAFNSQIFVDCRFNIRHQIQKSFDNLEVTRELKYTII